MNALRPLGLIMLSTICFFAAQGTGIGLFFHLAYILIGLLILAFGWAWLNLHGLKITREILTLRAHVGEFARERITLENQWWCPKLWVEVRDHSTIPRHQRGFVATLQARQHTRWIARTPCVVRGKFQLGPTTLISGDPFAIVRLERHIPTTNEIVVYPQLIELPQFALPDAELPGGQHIRSRAYQVTPNVATVRDYAPGDGFNRIHWRTTARTGQLMVKEFELDPSADVYIVLDLQERAAVRDTRSTAQAAMPANRRFFWEPGARDQRRHMTPPELASTEEYAVMAAASIAKRLLDQRRAVGMIAWGQEREVLLAEREPRQMFKLLEALAVLRAHAAQPLSEILIAESQRFSRNTTLVVITSAIDERWPLTLRQLLYRGIRAVVVFIDPRSFGGWQDADALLEQLVALRVHTYRLRQHQPLAEALSSALPR